MRPFTDTLPFADALRLVMAAVVPITRTETVRLTEARDRVAARDVTAGMDVPSFDRAAMDGYAVIASDTTGASAAAPRTLRVTGVLFTGHASQPEGSLVSGGECVEIATGAPMPAGANAVVMVEQTSRHGDDVQFTAEAAVGQNIGRRGADMIAGDVIIRAGTTLSPARLGAVAAVGIEQVEVVARPSVAIVSTGQEVVAAGHRLEPGQIYDVNRVTLSGVVAQHGGIAVPLPARGDALDELVLALDAAARHDIAVFSGGSSVGNKDLMRDALRVRGEVIFHGISVKPGKPTLFGRWNGTPVFGMPGYPASCLSNAYMLLLPMLRATARLPGWEPRTIDLPLARAVVSPHGRHQFYTVRIHEGRAEPAFKASGDITSMANADGYIEIPAATGSIGAGTVVRVICF
ncbi:MAG: gephyrin-like molybdotransferase Glp [Acidobacteriota bacterium]